MKNEITIQTWREDDDDCYLWQAEARRDGLTGHGHGYNEQTAIDRAKESLIQKEKNLSPSSPNWENTIESHLCRGVAEIDKSIGSFLAKSLSHNW